MAWAALRPVVKACIGGSLIGITVSDRYFSVAAVHGGSIDGREYALVKRSPLYDYSRGEVVVFLSPADHRSRTIKRLIGLPGDWISVPDKEEIRQIPDGHCWVEGDNGSASWDSRSYGPVPLGLVQGRVTHVVWPPGKMGRVDKRVPPEGRVMPQQRNL
ncbi:mitochondrial inner membrane protease subunit 2-like isoform X2 [Triticum dicoccoides]|uniref:mitochondrial inner membrane protease subunit 2-like isoform X2 n=1 Tax=Triticum dicoccoides TaxID=85692 RepID=UPI00188E9CE5|nr:mitochondrial inner membrane protease subunit 2-like isoform X2 [Triticum dicoccoides]